MRRSAGTTDHSDPDDVVAQQAQANCVTCGFYVPLAGLLGMALGACTNEYSPADGRVVDAELRLRRALGDRDRRSADVRQHGHGRRRIDSGGAPAPTAGRDSCHRGAGRSGGRRRTTGAERLSAPVRWTPWDDRRTSRPGADHPTDARGPAAGGAIHSAPRSCGGWCSTPGRRHRRGSGRTRMREEALAIGGYAGRVLVELASNAADAARELGVPARIRVRLHRR